MPTTETMDIIADDDIDTETLQAQINMSMSFAEDLVSSWIKPAHKAKLSKSTVNAQKLLDEQLRRPARLGVGAPIPESSASARDAVRLKHQLTGKGKKRSSADETSLTPRHQSEEEEERRGGTAKKKTKLDPFAGRSKMKAKLDVTAVIQSTHDPSSPHMHEDDKDSKTRGEEQGHDGQSISSSLGASIIDEGSYAKKKKRQRYCDTGKEGSFQEEVIPRSHPQAITTPNRSSSDRSISANPPPPSGSEPSSMSFSISGPLSLALQPVVKRHGELNVPDISIQPLPLGAEDLTVPLLNLDGPPARRDGSGKDDNPDSSPKKKRKRRKKKKHHIKVDG